MMTEERVRDIEHKLDELIDLLKFIVQVDVGIKVDATNIILQHLDELKENV